MIFFFGTRSSNIGQRQLRNTKCPHCQTQDSFVSATFGTYAHFFWIPLFPISKTTVAECSHCKKTYAKKEFTDQMQRSLDRENEVNPSKRPIWHGCGCLIIVAVVVLFVITGIIGAIFSSDEISETINDVRFKELKADKDRVTSKLSFETDSISFSVQQCINMSLDGIATKKIKYASKVKENKLLIILKVSDMKQIEKSSRKELVYSVEECLAMLDYEAITEQYIAIDGNWNMLMVKTPYKSDLAGKFADEKLLLSFYDEEDKGILLESNVTNEETLDDKASQTED